MSSQTNVLVPINTTGVNIAGYSVTWNSVSSALQGLAVVDPTSLNPAQVLAAGTQGAYGLVVIGTGTSGSVVVSGNVGISGNVSIGSLPGSPAQDGVDGSGITPPTGASGIRGWLSGLYKNSFNGLITSTAESGVSVGGFNTTPSNLSSATIASPLYLKGAAGRLCRVVNTATVATPSSQTIYFINQPSGAATATPLYSFQGMAAGQIIDLQMIFSSGIGVYSSGLNPPAAPSGITQAAGGSLAATTYYVKVTYVTAAGETTASAETSFVASANDVITVPSPSASTGATGWNVYVSNTAGGGSGAETKQNTTAIAIGTNWTEPTTGLISGAALPTQNTGVVALPNNLAFLWS